MEIKKTAEELAMEVNQAIGDIKEMVTKSATVEALNEAVKEFEVFKAENDTAQYTEKMSGLENDIKKLNHLYFS